MGRRGLRCIGRRRDMYGTMLDCCSVVRFREVAAAGMAMGQLVMTRNRGCFGFTPCWYVILILSENLARPLRATTPSAFVPSHRYPEHRCNSHLPKAHRLLPHPPFPHPTIKTPPSVSASNPTPRFSEPQHPTPFSLSQPPALTPHQPHSQRSLHNPSPDRPSISFNAQLAISATRHARRAEPYVGYSAPVRLSRGSRAEV